MFIWDENAKDKQINRLTKRQDLSKNKAKNKGLIKREICVRY